MRERKFMITTIDNPFNPFDDFNNWFLFDIEKGYYTCSKLARLTNNSDGMTQKEEIDDVERAIERLIEIDPLDIYVKIEKNGKKTQKTTKKDTDETEKSTIGGSS